ncbi:hypothetical protein EON81_11660 [bacterium]|nr:MAG: hypothetical protein EON81_11660 [bacterium]
MKRFLAFGLLALASSALAKPLDFDYKDPKEMSAVSLTLDSFMEPMVGYARGISGKVQFDPEHPERAIGKLAVEVSSVQFSNDGYTQTAQGYALNGKKWPQLTLEIRKVESVKKIAAGRFEGVVLADFTCRGVTKPKRLKVSATYLPGRAEERTNGQHKGDLLVLRTQFGVSRREHGISEGIPDDLVGDTVQVGVAVVGIHYVEPPKLTVERRWEMEVGFRDDPLWVQVERGGKTLRVRAGDQVVDGTILSEQGGRVAFQLEPNASYGPAKGELIVAGDRTTGSLKTREGEIPLRGRAVTRFETVPKVELKGRGFASLDLPKMMGEAGTSGMAVARIRDHALVETGRFGVVRAGEVVPVDEGTLFQAGSMGQPVLHIAALKLVSLGQLDLQKTVNFYLKEEGIPAGEKGWGEQITVRDLMRNTAGFAHDKFAGIRPDAKAPSLRESLGKLEIAKEPGTAEGTSAVNEALLELVVAKAAGRPAAQVVTDLVFAPLGIKRSGYGAHPAGAASGHYSSGQPTFDGYHVYPAALESGLWTNAKEFGTFLVELGKLIAGRPNLLLEEKDRPLLAQVDSAKSILAVRKGEEGDYYLGGDPYGFYCQFYLDKTAGEGALVLQNRMMAWQLSGQVAKAVRGVR